jgi:hypothetical protein
MFSFPSENEDKKPEENSNKTEKKQRNKFGFLLCKQEHQRKMR